MVEEHQGERRWIVEPPLAAGEVSLYVAIGEGVELTAEQEAALSELMRTLESDDAEVTGHAPCKLSFCTDKSCKPVKCSVFNCSGLTVSWPVADSGGSWSLMGSFGPV